MRNSRFREITESPPGERVRLLFKKNRIVIESVQLEADDDPFAAFTEWASEADEKAYKAL